MAVERILKSEKRNKLYKYLLEGYNSDSSKWLFITACTNMAGYADRKAVLSVFRTLLLPKNYIVISITIDAVKLTEEGKKYIEEFLSNY